MACKWSHFTLCKMGKLPWQVLLNSVQQACMVRPSTANSTHWTPKIPFWICCSSEVIIKHFASRDLQFKHQHLTSKVSYISCSFFSWIHQPTVCNKFLVIINFNKQLFILRSSGKLIWVGFSFPSSWLLHIWWSLSRCQDVFIFLCPVFIL